MFGPEITAAEFVLGVLIATGWTAGVTVFVLSLAAVHEAAGWLISKKQGGQR